MRRACNGRTTQLSGKMWVPPAQPIRLSLSAESASHSAVFFFSHNSIFCHDDLSAKRTRTKYLDGKMRSACTVTETVPKKVMGWFVPCYHHVLPCAFQLHASYAQDSIYARETVPQRKGRPKRTVYFHKFICRPSTTSTILSTRFRMLDPWSGRLGSSSCTTTIISDFRNREHL